MSSTDYITACEWRKRNEKLFNDKIVLPALNDAAHGRPVLIKAYCEDIRRKDRVDSTGQPVKVQNNHASIFARMVWVEHPEVRPHLRLRKSGWDDLFGIKIGVDGKPRMVG